MVESGRLMVVSPPEDGETYVCVKCGEEIDYISIVLPPEGGPQEQVNHHCHCQLDKDEFARQASSTR